MVFDSEAAFEEAVIDGLKSYGWDDAGGVLRYPTEQDLIDNWASILYENNKHRDCLNNVPLTATEMQQIIEQVVAKRTPVAINELINGKEIVIKRDNPGDKLHEGRDVALKIFHRDEIAGGSSPAAGISLEVEVGSRPQGRPHAAHQRNAPLSHRAEEERRARERGSGADSQVRP